MSLKLSLELEGLSGTAPKEYLPGEPILFAVALENTGSEAVEAVSVSKENGVCIGTVRDSEGTVIGSGSFLRFLSVGHKLQPAAPTADRLERVQLAAGERDEVRDNFLRLLSKPLPPGQYRLEVTYDAPQLKLRSAVVHVQVMEPVAKDVHIAWSADRELMHITLVTEQADRFVVRHEARSARFPSFIIHHGTLTALSTAVTAAAESGSTPRQMSDPIWIAWAASDELGMIRSWAGVPQGDPMRVPPNGLTAARMGGQVRELEGRLVVPITGRAGNATVLELLVLDRETGAQRHRHRIPLSESDAVVSEIFWFTAERAGVVVAQRRGNETELEAVQFNIDSGELVGRLPLASVVDRVLAIDAAPQGQGVTFAAALQQDRGGVSQYYALVISGDAGKPSAVERRRLSFSTVEIGKVRETRVSAQPDRSGVVVMATDDGGLHISGPNGQMQQVATGIRWPQKGLCLGPVVHVSEGRALAYFSHDAGLTFQTLDPH
jgi:hypothetical protein